MIRERILESLSAASFFATDFHGLTRMLRVIRIDLCESVATNLFDKDQLRFERLVAIHSP